MGEPAGSVQRLSDALNVIRQRDSLQERLDDLVSVARLINRNPGRWERWLPELREVLVREDGYEASNQDRDPAKERP